MKLIYGLLAGIFFGVVLVKGGVTDWSNIQAMFHFQSPLLYLVIGSGVAVAALGVLFVKSLGSKTIAGQPVEFRPKAWQKGIVFGGALFGVGWYITGACPGPIFTQVGSGAGLAWFTLGGALVGTVLYGALKKKLPH